MWHSTQPVPGLLVHACQTQHRRRRFWLSPFPDIVRRHQYWAEVRNRPGPIALQSNIATMSFFLDTGICLFSALSKPSLRSNSRQPASERFRLRCNSAGTGPRVERLPPFAEAQEDCCSTTGSLGFNQSAYGPHEPSPNPNMDLGLRWVNHGAKNTPFDNYRKSSIFQLGGQESWEWTCRCLREISEGFETPRK